MGHIFLSFLFFNVILFIFYNNYKKGHYYIKKSSLVFYTILLIAFGTYGTGEGDYLHYKENVALFKTLYDVEYYNGMEVQYNYLAYFVGGNYTLWRLVIFSIQFIGMGWLLYKAKLNTYPVFMSIIAICLVAYTYQRSYWGVIFYFAGFLLLLEKKNPLFLFIMFLCVASHTQNALLLILLPLGFIDIKKWELLLVILLFGALASALKDHFSLFLDSGGIENAKYINSKLGEYGEGGTAFFGSSIGEQLLFVFRYVPLAMFTLAGLKMLLKNKKRYMLFAKSYRGVMNITIGLIIVALVILAADLGAGIFFYRILAMALFSFSILLCYMVNIGVLKEKMFKLYILISIIATEISYVKDLYYAYASGNY